MRKFIVISGLMLVGVVLALLITSPTAVADPAEVRINAPPEVAQDSDFTVRVDIYGVTDLVSATIGIMWDPTDISYASYIGVLPGTVDSTPLEVDALFVDNNLGILLIACNVSGIAPCNASGPVIGVNGSGYLAEIGFHVEGPLCNVTNIALEDLAYGGGSLSLINSTCGEINATWSSDNTHIALSSVIITPTPTPTESPTPTPSVTVVPPMAVVVNAPAEVPVNASFYAWVNISNAQFMAGNSYSANYTLQCNHNVVRISSVSAGMINTTTIPVTDWDYDSGVLHVVQNFSATTNATGNGYLCRLGCLVVGAPCNESSIAFSALASRIFNVSAAMANMSVTWAGDSVHVSGPTTVLSPTPTPTLAVVVDAPAEVTENGSFSAQVDIVNLDIDPGNYSASYVLTYNPNIIRVTDVSDGMLGSSSIPVTSWSFLPSGVQGVLSVVQNISAATAVNGSGYLAEIDFDVVGRHCNTSDIDFNKTASRLYVLPAMTTLNATWIDDAVHVRGPTPSPTPTATYVYSLTVNQTSSCCNVSVIGYGNVTAGNSTTWSNISSGAVISVNASYNGSCDIWGNWTAGVNNVSAMNTTVTMNANKSITANCSYTGADEGGGGMPGWVWPVVGVMLFSTLGLFIYALYRGGYLDNLMPRMRGWFGGDIEDYVAPDFEDEDMYDNLYGDTGPGIRPGTGGGSEMDDDLI